MTGIYFTVVFAKQRAMPRLGQGQCVTNGPEDIAERFKIGFMVVRVKQFFF
jgi:hypothetical protein